MQALPEALMPDDPEEDTGRPFRDWWPDAVEWISDNAGVTKQDALFYFFNQVSRGLVRAVNGFLDPLPRHLFPNRFTEELTYYTQKAKDGPLTYAKQYLPPDRQTLISWADLLKLCPPKRPASPTAADEKKAITVLVDRLKADRHLGREAALKICREHFPKLSERGFRSRIWPDAREGAQLPRVGSPGRKPKREPPTP
jgi:hypothetical protein